MRYRRSVASHQNDFARQLAERNQSDRAQKRFKTSAPKGVKLAEGYVDRAQNRETTENDDREARLKALEESLKKEEIDRETYEQLRFQIAGGDLESTHLVKGLDFKLLERIRRGEDVYSGKPSDSTKSSTGDDEDVDDAFDELETQEVHAIEREQAAKKKGQLSTVVTGKKRTRDQILADMKAARAAAKAQAEPALGDRFRKIGTTQKLGTRIERDSKGREVLIIVDADGHEKRKVRKPQPGEEEQPRSDLPMPDKDAMPLGMEVPEQYRKTEEPNAEDDGEVNIFDDVGDDYDPLAGMDESGSDSDSESTNRTTNDNDVSQDKSATPSTSMPPPPKPQTSTRNYFQDSKTRLISEEAGDRAPSMSDPAIMAAIKKAAALRPIETEDDDDESREDKKAAEERRKKLLQMSQRDDDDLDMGFGTSRYEDEEDFEDHKLSSWGDNNDDGEGGSSRNARGGRKKGSKKRKGDGKEAEDFLRMMGSRKA